MIQHLRGREKALESFDWKGREAEWVALVCLHSGVFTRVQFRHFFDSGDNRKRASRFVRDLLERGLGVEDDASHLSPEAQKRSEYPTKRFTASWELRTSVTAV